MIHPAHPDRRVLVTIPISHYCEKARWALQRAGLAYHEQPHVQGVHRLAVRRAGGGRTAPVLVTPDGVFADSRAIVFYADAHHDDDARLYPRNAATRADVLALEERFDTVLGPEGRRWMYQYALADPGTFVPFNLHGVPEWQRRTFRPLLPGTSRLIKRYLDVTPQTARRAEGLIDAEFDAVAERLADGRPYLAGERFSAADLAFAALAAPALCPQRYGVPLPQPDVLPEAMAASVRAWRAHPAGQFALALYRDERPGPAPLA